LILSLEDHLELSMEQIKSELEYFTYPIFQENRNGKPELIASSVAIELGGSNFLCTAAHVLKNINDNQPILLGDSTTHKTGSLVDLDLSGKAIFTKQAHESDVDLCLINLNAIKENLNFLNERKITMGNDFRSGGIHLLLGYPLSKNKVTKIINLKLNEVKTRYLTVGVKIDGSINLSHFDGKKGNIHFGFRYDIDHMKQALPFPKGLSGGGVWYVPNIYEMKRFYLAGIFIEYHKKDKVGIATKAQYIKRLAEQFVLSTSPIIL